MQNERRNMHTYVMICFVVVVLFVVGFFVWCINPYPSRFFFCHRVLQWRHYERNSVSNHRRLDCLLNRLFKRRSKKHQSSASLVFMMAIQRWPLNSPGQRSSNAEDVSIWWRHHGLHRWRLKSVTKYVMWKDSRGIDQSKDICMAVSSLYFRDQLFPAFYIQNKITHQTRPKSP